MAIVEFRNVSKEYQVGKVKVSALKNVSLEIAEGSFTALSGPSGSGKTTILNLIGCVDSPTDGKISIDGEHVEGMPERRRSDFRLRKLGFIFQSFNLIPVLNVIQNVELPLLLRGDTPKAERRRRAHELLEQVGLSAQLRQRPNQLSGGQMQRVAIARALIGRPKLVLADEPTANLDSATAATIIDLMSDMNRRSGTTFVISTHDPSIIAMAPVVVRVKDGQLLPT